MGKKLNVTVLCGGQSAEHEISILSASNVVAALNQDKYIITVVYITRQGAWYMLDSVQTFLKSGPQHLVKVGHCQPITINLGNANYPLISLENFELKFSCDCVIPILHGPMGEDGTLQGLFEILNVPYVGANVLGSAMCMEKHIAKSLLRFANLPTPDWIMLNQCNIKQYPYEIVSAQLGEIVFIKPAGLGSSVGITKVKNKQAFKAAIDLAFKYDDFIMIEPNIQGREIECSVLGNENPVASLPGEIITHHEFYSYEAKYLDPNGASVITPTDLSKEVVKRVQELAIAAFNVLHCASMARIDFFVNDETVLINEVNTIPGFTNISLYPKNWEVSGLAYSELLDNLIQLALARYQQKNKFLNFYFTKSAIDGSDPKLRQTGLG